MNRILVIARREFTEVLRNRMFWISILLPVGIMAGALIWGEKRGGHHEMEAREKNAMGAFLYFFAMFMSIMPTSQMLLTSLIEEKSSRVIEVLLSAVSPFQLLAGKILGLVAVGLVSGAAFVTIMGVSAGFSGALQAPGAGLLLLFLVYYLLGFMLMASIFAGVGATCNTLKEAQTFMMPLMLIMILPFMLMGEIARNPNGTLAVGLTLFPITAPTVTVLRAVMAPRLPWGEVAASLLILAVSVPCALWVAAKVFRTGILLYGKPPRLTEILRWIKSA